MNTNASTIKNNASSFQFVAKSWIFGEVKAATAVTTSNSGVIFED